MNDVAVEANLDYFRGRVSVRGESVLAKAKFVHDRWLKVIEDCQKSNDQSPYRVLFCNAHKEPAELLSSLIAKDLKDEDLSRHIKMLKYKFLTVLKEYNVSNSATDALCYIILELEATEVFSNV